MPDNAAMDDRDEALFAQQQVVRLQALLEASRLIHSTIVLDDVLNTVLQIVVRELELDGAFFKHFLNSYGDVPQSFSVPDREAVINAILHGNKKDPAKQVHVDFELNDEALRIKIADEGAGLDPDTVPDPLAPENILRSSGRGIFLMRAIMDEVHFHQLNPGTEIELIKHRVKKELSA